MSNQPEQPNRDEIIRKLMLFRQIVAQSETTDLERTKIESELWRTEVLTRAVIENSPIGITVRSADGKLLLFNAAWLRIWGLNEARARELDQQTEGWPVEKRYGYLGAWTERVREAFETGREVFVPEASLENYTPRSVDWISLHFYPIRDQQGRVEQMVTLTQDVSARKLAEQELEAVRARLELLLRSTPAVIFSCQAGGDGRVTFISENVKQELGYAAEEWLNSPGFWADHIHPEERAVMDATGLPLATARSRLKEYRFRHRDGIYRWLYEESNPIPEHGNGPSEAAGYFIDITARKWAEETLRESEERFRTLLDNVRDIVFTCHATGTITSLNPAFSAVTGWPRDGMIGRPLSALVHPDDASVTSDRTTAGLRGEPAAPFEARILTRNGRTIILEFYVTPQVKNNAVIGLLGVARDITVRKQAEQALRQSEQYYRELFENAHDPIIVFIPETEQVLDVNRRACEVYGYSREEFLSLSLTTVSKDVARDKQHIGDTLQRGSYVNFETTHFRKDGRPLYLEINASLIEYHGRRAILSINRDITGRRDAELALRASESLNRAVIEHSPIGISIRSPEGRLLSYNRSWQEIWAMSEADITQDLETERTELRFDRKDNYLRDWLPKVEQIYRTGGMLFIPELKISKPSFDADKYIAQYFYALPGSDHTVDRVVVITQDITERKRKDQEITILAQAVRSTSECISITDDKDILLFVNDAFCRTYGYNRDELIGRHIGMVLSPLQDQSCLADIPARTLDGGWQGDLLNRRKDGTDFPIFLSTAVVRDEHGLTVALIGVARDISEQKRTEAQREKLREAMLQARKLEAMGTMAGGIAHDFNNLLTVIQGSAEMLRMRLPQGDPLLSEVSRITGAAGGATGLTRQLLLFSRRQPLDLSSCNCNRSVDDTLRALRERLPESVEVETELPGDVWPARADAAGVGQVLGALVTNAVEAMPGGGRLTVRTANAELDEASAAAIGEARPGRFVKLTVVDTGPGISPEDAPHVFEPFFSTKGPGKGLGLSAAYGIVKQFQGWITFSGTGGQGTEFTVYLPAQAKVDILAAPAPVPEEFDGKQQLVLMVEDEPGIRKVFAAMLRLKGYQIEEAGDVAEAKALFERRADDIALVFSDILLPDGNGLDLVRELSAARAGLKVILTSGFTGDDARLATIKELGYAFLPKPYALQPLLKAFKEILASR